MTTQAAKAKQKKKRAAKHKHEHETEQMAEEAAKHKRSSRMEWVAIIIMLMFVPFMITGIIWWPPAESSSSNQGTVLPDGTYEASFFSSQPATISEPAVAALDVNGKPFIVTEADLSGDAARDPAGFFDHEQGDMVELQVQNGYITDWSPAIPTR